MVRQNYPSLHPGIANPMARDLVAEVEVAVVVASVAVVVVVTGRV